MSEQNLSVRLLHKNDTQENWENSSLVLLNGEVGFDTTNGLFKVGDGVSLWNEINQSYRNYEDVVDLIDGKQNSLISGQNIKTINGESILGSGNIVVEGGSGGGSLSKHPFTIVESDWVISETYESYIWEAEINASGITENSFVLVSFDADSTIKAVSANVLSSGNVSTDSIKLFARKVPAGDLVGILSY